MSVKLNEETQNLMRERFGKDSLIALATTEDGIPYVRTVNSYYEDGAFYIITHGLSNKMKQIEKNQNAAIAGEWFTGHGIGENLGYIRKNENAELAKKLRAAFASWYGNGHTNEDDPNTCILRIRLKNGILFYYGTRYDIEF